MAEVAALPRSPRAGEIDKEHLILETGFEQMHRQRSLSHGSLASSLKSARIDANGLTFPGGSSSSEPIGLYLLQSDI